MSGDGLLWRTGTTVGLVAVTGITLPALPSEPVELRLLALAGAGLVLLGLGILTKLVMIRE